MILAIPVGAYIVLQNSRAQTLLSQFIASEISSSLDTKITIDKVYITFINRFQLKNLYIEDLNGDTLLYAPKINLGIQGINIKDKILTLKKATLHDSYIQFITDTTGTINMKFIIDKIRKSEDRIKTDSEPWRLKIRNAELKNSRFVISDEVRKPYKGGIDLTNMDMNEVNLSISDMQIKGDTIEMQIGDIQLTEKSGFHINSFSSSLSIGKNYMHFKDVVTQTPWSEIHSPYVQFSFSSFQDFSDVINLVNIKLNLEPSHISFKDISYFAPTLIGYNEDFRISGNISGRINDMSGKDIFLQYSRNTLLETNFNLIGLPDFKATFMHFDIDRFMTTNADIELFKIPGSKKKIELPDNLKKLGNINYSGKFTGYPDDFVTYGKFRTDLGEISTDILLKPDTTNTLRFTGRLKTMDFKLGELIDASDKIDKISMDGNISGISSKGKLFANIESTIDSFRILGYNYQSINISGELTESSFDGSFDISDPNISMDFSGRADFSGENPEYAFTANVVRARPYYLNIYKSDPSFFLSFLLETNFTGNSLDNMEGEISLVNSLFSNSENQIQMYDFTLKSITDNLNSGSIIIRSDLLDGEITGEYHFSTLPASINKLVNNYIPTLSTLTDPVIWKEDHNNFTFNFRFKNIHPSVEFFFPGYDFGNNAVFSGAYNPTEKKIEINGDFPLFTFKENDIENISVKAFASNDTYEVSASSSAFVLGNNMKLENIQLIASVFTDTVDARITWDNRATPRYAGEIDLTTVFDENRSTGNTQLKIHTSPSSFVFNDTLWHISESVIEVDTNSVRIDTFGISNQQQDFFIFGKLSSNPDDALFMKFSDMDIATFNLFTSRAKITMGGYLSGEATLRDPLNKPIFLSDLHIRDLEINKDKLGDGKIGAIWNNSQKKIALIVETIKGENKQLSVVGDYFPENGLLDFNINLDKLRVSLFEPYLADLISDLKGMATGKLTMKGTLKAPDLNGTVQLQKSSTLVDYLMTSYYFTNELRVINNNIVFKNFEIFDEKGSRAVADGTVFMNNLKNIRLDIRLNATNFAFLNTTEKDNELFYGEVHAGGIVRITGPVNDLLMDINAKTERNSVFYIPLYGAEEVYEQDFIQWVSADKDKEDEADIKSSGYEVNLKGLKMNFNLEITPDAQIQLIFDPKVGDKMRGWGSGNLKMMINTLGKFEIYGEMTIERGDYLFTLKNLINKYFEVERGGTISWDGDPLDANIDLKAVYRLKASVFNIAPEPMESLRRRIPVDILFRMSGKLMNPLITPDIQLPTADQETRNIVSNRITTDEDMMKQFLSLLIINNFYSDMNPAGFGGTAQRGSGIAGSELFTNQLSNWLSQISKDFDLGVNYRPGDELTSNQLEVALSTQLLNDRVRINTNLGMGGGQTAAAPASNPNNIVGDFDVDFQITKSGKLHIKAFNRSNDNLLIRTSPYTQGAGFTYREDFNSFGELMRRYKESISRLFSKEKRELKREEEVEEMEAVDSRE